MRYDPFSYDPSRHVEPPEYRAARNYKEIGVYFLFNKDKKILYIGKSTSCVRSRIRDNITRNKKLLNKIYFFKVIKATSTADIAILEMYYINLLTPPYNIEGVGSNLTIQLFSSYPSLEDLKFKTIKDYYGINSKR